MHILQGFTSQAATRFQSSATMLEYIRHLCKKLILYTFAVTYMTNMITYKLQHIFVWQAVRLAALAHVFLNDFFINVIRCLCASVAVGFLIGWISSDPNPGIHMFQLRSNHTRTAIQWCDKNKNMLTTNYLLKALSKTWLFKGKNAYFNCFYMY